MVDKIRDGRTGGQYSDGRLEPFIYNDAVKPGVTGKFNTLVDEVGTIGSLTTTNKTSLVDAINELKTGVDNSLKTNLSNSTQTVRGNLVFGENIDQNTLTFNHTIQFNGSVIFSGTSSSLSQDNPLFSLGNNASTVDNVDSGMIVNRSSNRGNVRLLFSESTDSWRLTYPNNNTQYPIYSEYNVNSQARGLLTLNRPSLNLNLAGASTIGSSVGGTRTLSIVDTRSITPPTVTIVGDGTGATATVNGVLNGALTGVTVNNGGTGYTSATVVFSHGDAVATATITGGIITGITLTGAGTQYVTPTNTSSVPEIEFSFIDSNGTTTSVGSVGFEGSGNNNLTLRTTQNQSGMDFVIPTARNFTFTGGNLIVGSTDKGVQTASITRLSGGSGVNIETIKFDGEYLSNSGASAPNIRLINGETIINPVYNSVSGAHITKIRGATSLGAVDIFSANSSTGLISLSHSLNVAGTITTNNIQQIGSGNVNVTGKIVANTGIDSVASNTPFISLIASSKALNNKTWRIQGGDTGNTNFQIIPAQDDNSIPNKGYEILRNANTSSNHNFYVGSNELMVGVSSNTVELGNKTSTGATTINLCSNLNQNINTRFLVNNVVRGSLNYTSSTDNLTITKNNSTGTALNTLTMTDSETSSSALFRALGGLNTNVIARSSGTTGLTVEGVVFNSGAITASGNILANVINRASGTDGTTVEGVVFKGGVATVKGAGTTNTDYAFTIRDSSNTVVTSYTSRGMNNRIGSSTTSDHREIIGGRKIFEGGGLLVASTNADTLEVRDTVSGVGNADPKISFEHSEGISGAVTELSSIVARNSGTDYSATSKHTFLQPIHVDTINERSLNNGINLDGVVLKDGGATFTSPISCTTLSGTTVTATSAILTNNINERTTNSGVIVAGNILKNSTINSPLLYSKYLTLSNNSENTSTDTPNIGIIFDDYGQPTNKNVGYFQYERNNNNGQIVWVKKQQGTTTTSNHIVLRDNSTEVLKDIFVNGNRVWHNGDAPSANGYYKFPNGLIIQWGGTNFTLAQSITFPIAFPNYALSISFANWGGEGVPRGNSITRFGFTFVPVGASCSAYWIAIGN